MVMDFLSPALECNSKWNLSSNQGTWLTSAVFVGNLFGAFYWGSLADAKGRIYSLKRVTALTFVFGFFTACSWDFYSVAFLRFMVGAQLAGFGIGFTYFLELTPKSSRGRLSAL